MKRVWLNLHRWVGLKLFILLSFVLITGTLATISHEIDWLIDPARRVSPAAAPAKQDWDGLVEAAREARPDWSIHWVAAPLDPWHSAEVVGATPEGTLKRLLIHPGTLEIRGERGWFNAQRLFRDSHRRLMIFNVWGIILVSSLSILLMLSLISGLFVYKKFWRGFFKKPRMRDARTFWGDMHRLGGVWSLWFIAVIALTGFWYLIEALGNATGQRVGPFPEQAPPAAYMQSETAQTSISYLELAARAEATLENYRITALHMPKFAGDPVEFYGHSKAILVRERANQVTFDSASGEMTSVTKGETLSAMQRVSEMADPLHFGTFGGFWTKILYFLFGVILSAMSLSGVYVFSARIRNADAKAVLKAERKQFTQKATA
ncbi:MAG: PepSY-associated TM helix domain-containing protein [Pseudomonadota bacterium]